MAYNWENVLPQYTVYSWVGVVARFTRHEHVLLNKGHITCKPPIHVIAISQCLADQAFRAANWRSQLYVVNVESQCFFLSLPISRAIDGVHVRGEPVRCLIVTQTGTLGNVYFSGLPFRLAYITIPVGMQLCPAVPCGAVLCVMCDTGGGGTVSGPVWGQGHCCASGWMCHCKLISTAYIVTWLCHLLRVCRVCKSVVRKTYNYSCSWASVDVLG